MAGYRYRGKPDLSQANRDIMAERSKLDETELAQRLGELDKHIREYPYMPVRPLVAEGSEGTEDQNAGRMACATPPGRT